MGGGGGGGEWGVEWGSKFDFFFFGGGGRGGGSGPPLLGRGVQGPLFCSKFLLKFSGIII